MSHQMGVDGLTVCTAMYFVPSVTCALQGHSHRLLAAALGLSIPETLLARGQSEPRLVAVGDSRGKRPPKTEPNDVVPAVAGVPDAEGRAEEPRIEVPGAAANDTVTTAAGCPS